MPLRDYACSKCFIVEERLVSAREEQSCEKCGKKMVAQMSIPSAPVIRGADGRSSRLGGEQVHRTKDFTYKVKNVEK